MEFLFFICNEGKLMLKIHLINKYRNVNIYYKENSNKTIMIWKCLQYICKNEKLLVGKNLTKIIRLRNKLVSVEEEFWVYTCFYLET